MMRDLEKIKKEIECFTIQDLADIIRREPLIAGRISTLGYNKKQREELKSCMLDIAKKVLDLSELEGKFLEENKAELKELLKKHLDRETYNILKELF